MATHSPTISTPTKNKGYANVLAAVDKNVAHGEEDAEETVETEETDETEERVEGKVHSNMVYFDTHTRKKLTIALLDNAIVHSEARFLGTVLQRAEGENTTNHCYLQNLKIRANVRVMMKPMH